MSIVFLFFFFVYTVCTVCTVHTRRWNIMIYSGKFMIDILHSIWHKMFTQIFHTVWNVKNKNTYMINEDKNEFSALTSTNVQKESMKARGSTIKTPTIWIERKGEIEKKNLVPFSNGNYSNGNGKRRIAMLKIHIFKSIATWNAKKK